MIASNATIRDVSARIDELFSRWDSGGDYRAVFICSYRDITGRMQQAVTGGEFEDNHWMEGLDVEFAQIYFDAVGAYDSGTAGVPNCWRIAFDRACQKKSTVLEDLLLGMNAHINHDLPVALYQRSLAPAERPVRERDYEKVNDLLAGMIKQIQNDVCSRYSFLLGFLDRAAGCADELLTDVGIRIARKRAWDNGITLADAPDENARAGLLAKLDKVASAKALLLTAPGSRLSAPIRLLRSWDRALSHRFL